MSLCSSHGYRRKFGEQTVTRFWADYSYNRSKNVTTNVSTYFLLAEQSCFGVEEQSVNFWGPMSNDHNILGTKVSLGRKVRVGLTLVLNGGGGRTPRLCNHH